MHIDRSGQQNVRGMALTSWLQHHGYWATVIIFIVSLVPRLFLTLCTDQQDLNFPDSPTYFANAASLLERGEILDARQKPEVFRTPGYPVFLVAIMLATGTTAKGLDTEDLHAVLIVQTVITSLSVVVLYLLARRILPPIEAFTGAWLAALSPWGAAMAGFPLTEGFYLLILASLFFVMYLVVDHTINLPSVIAGGILIGLLASVAVLVRPIWPLVLLIAIALFLLCGNQRKKALILVAVMLITATTPLYLWKARNLREAQFDGLSIVPGVNAYQYFAPSIKAQLKDAEGDRWAMLKAARNEEKQWSQGLSIQEANDERWRRANAFFKEHPFLTSYTFVLNAGEALIHPHPQILKPARLNFTGDTWALAGLWMGLLTLAVLGLRYSTKAPDYGLIERKWMAVLLVICLSLTLTSGITYGAGARLRAPMELIIPLLAAIGLIRIIRMLRQN